MKELRLRPVAERGQVVRVPAVQRLAEVRLCDSPRPTDRTGLGDARHLYPSIGRRYVIAGRSQGGQSALFAAAESTHDAPGLTFAGVAAFAPASHLGTQVQAAGALTEPGGGLSALGALILTGAAAASQAVDLHALLTPAAYALVPAVQRECTAALSAPNSWGGLAPAQIQRPGADPTALG